MRKSSDPFAPPRKARVARSNSLSWLLEPMERDANYQLRKMFGCDAAYLDGLLYLVIADRDAPWNGVMVCTSQEHHAALMADVPGLLVHPTLGKWLYLPQTDEAFESQASTLVSMALARDARMGVTPKPKASRRKSWRTAD
ncbi:hypothetical protein [Achromobacter sp.]|uniref:hypothetical protein n=1 Tax=Achromobacter sp. TaxID=134375 RepID=UPI00257B0D15